MQQRVQLGRSSPITERRASYRLKHLNATEQESRWHARGIVHSILRYVTSHKKWHLKPIFRTANW